MINFQSAIAVYGVDEFPEAFQKEAAKGHISLIHAFKPTKTNDLGSRIRQMVNQTSALVIFQADADMHTLLQFYFAANKKVFFITEDDSATLPKGVKVLSSTDTIIKELLNEKERTVFESKIGKIELRLNDFGLTYLKVNKHDEITQSPSKQAIKIQQQLDDYLQGKRKKFNLKVCLKGTDFQRRVWAELCSIPYGHTISYGELAEKVGDTKASRAVGLANAKNPIWMIVPCHRVLSKEGDLTGYAGGLKLKQQLLDLESHQMRLF